MAEEERLINHFPEGLHHQMEQLVKQEKNKSCGFVYGNNEFMGSTNSSNNVTATSSPQSCITTFSGTNLMEFSSPTAPISDPPMQVPATADRSSEVGGTSTLDKKCLGQSKCFFIYFFALFFIWKILFF